MEDQYTNAFSVTDEQKAAFAAALVKKHASKFVAAQSVFGYEQDKVGLSLWASHYLPDDPTVKFYVKKFEEVKESNKLPSKEEAAKKAWDLIDDAKDHKDKAGYLALFCKIMKYTEDKSSVTVNNAIVNKVMEVPVHGTNDEWETKLKQQQAKLTNQNVH